MWSLIYTVLCRSESKKNGIFRPPTVAHAAIVVVALIVSYFIFKMDASGFIKSSLSGSDAKPMAILLFKLLYGICYVIAVVVGFRHLRKGGTLSEAFNMLFFEPLENLMSMFSGGK